MRASSSPAIVQESDQLSTRSLGEKFGVQTTGSLLDVAGKSQPLTLAESIRRKIAEMPKPITGANTGSSVDDDQGAAGASGDLAGASTDPHLNPVNSFAAWGIPDSPDWPKITTDAGTDQLPEGALASNSWGGWTSPPTGWNIPALKAESARSANVMSGAEEQGKLIDIGGQTASHSQPVPEKHMEIPSPSNWSSEAEQLETGSWQSVKFDTALGAPTFAAPSLSAMPLSTPSAPMFANPGLPKGEFVIDPSTSQPAEAKNSQDDWEMSIQEKKSGREQGMQLNTPPSPAVPSPAVPLPEAIAPPKMFPADNLEREKIAEKKEVDTGRILPVEPVAPRDPNQMASGGLKIYPVFSKRAAAIVHDQNQEGAGTNLNFQPAPGASNSSVEPPSPVAPAQQAPAKVEESKSDRPVEQPVMQVDQKVDDDAANASLLKRLDDRDIDALFSKNLGVHERALPAKSTKGTAIESSVPITEQAIMGADQQVKSVPEPVSSILVPKEVLPAASNQLSDQLQPPVVPGDLATAEAKPADTSGLLAPLDDNMIDQIFSASLGIPQQATSKKIPIVAPAQSEEVLPTVDLVKNDVSTMKAQPEQLNQISSPNDIAKVQEPEAPPPSPPPSLPPAAAPSVSNAQTESRQDSAKQSEFSASSSRAKIPGVGRLDSRSDIVSEAGSGRIASIGKFLLDNKDLEKIGKITGSDLSESGLRTLSLEASQELKNLLKQIDSLQGVIGTAIIGHDGLMIANTMPADTDAESLGVWAMGVYMGTTHVIDKLGNDRVRQIVSRTDRGYLVIANFGAGLLITLTNPLLIDNLLPLMRTITQLVAA